MFGRSTLTRRRRRRRSVRCNPPRSTTIVITITIPPQALLPSLASCLVARWCVAGGGEVNLRARASRKKLGVAVCSYADVWEFSSSVLGGWTGARPPRVCMETYRGVGGGGWWRTSGVMTVQAASRDFRNKDSDVYSRGVGVGLASIRRERGHLKVGMGALIPSVPRVQDLP